MYQTLQIMPGVTLRCIRDSRFKQGALSIQFLRRMDPAEAAYNALLPAVLLRGCREYPDIRRITQRLDDLYGASVGTLVRRIGDYQTTGFYCGFMEDRFALEGDEILSPMIHFLGQLLLEPIVEDGGFDREFVESEKRNLISAIESQRSDKRAYAAARLLEVMCQNDSFGIPRLGQTQQVQAIDHQQLYAHYQMVLAQSPVEIFYVGSAEPAQVAALVTPLWQTIHRQVTPLPPQTPYCPSQPCHETETQDIAQGKLSMGFSTPITNRDSRFAAMQVANAIFGSGMTSKLFMQVREKMSLCYDIGSGFHGSKGIMAVAAGIEFEKKEIVLQEIKHQLQQICDGNITSDELTAAKEALLSNLRATHDSPGAIEGYYASAAISGIGMTPAVFMDAIMKVSTRDVAEAAKTLQLCTVYFLKGET